MLNRMIVANLRRRPVRSLVSIVAVAIEVVLILMIVGLTNGMVNDQHNRIEGIGADVVVHAGGGSEITALSGNTMPLNLADVFAKVPGVAAVAGSSVGIASGIETVAGVNLPRFNAVSGGYRFLKGGPFHPGTQEVIVDDLQAASQHLVPGSKMTILGQPFTVTGVFEHGMGSRMAIDLGVLDRLVSSPGKVAVFYIKLKDPHNPAPVVDALKTMAPNENVQAIGEYLSLFTSSGISPALPIFQKVMVGIAVVIGFLVIFLSLYTTVLERTREIGILKSLGASKRYIIQAILRESEFLTVLGIVVGTVLAYVLWRALGHAFPTLTIEMTWQWVGWSALIAVVSSLVGALYPAAKAAAQDPIAALAYE